MLLQGDRLTTPPTLRVDDDAIEDLIRWYCRESGVRNLEKHVEKLLRKVALRVATRVEEVAVKARARQAAEAAAAAAAAESSAAADLPSDPVLTDVPVDPTTGAVDMAAAMGVGSGAAGTSTVGVDAVVEPQKQREADVPIDPLEGLGITNADLYAADEDWAVRGSNLPDYVGKRVFTSDR